MARSAVALKDHWKEQRLFLSRVIAAGVVVVVLTGLVITRLVQLQIIDYQRFSALSQDNRVKIEPLAPPRGLIFDRNGVVLADNVPTWELVAIAEEIPNLAETLAGLAEIELVDPAEQGVLVDLVRSHRGFERVKLSNLSEEQAARFAVRRHHFPGVDIQEALIRYYPYGAAAAHAIGYVGSISKADLERIDRRAYAASSQIGKSGIERAYEARLHGSVGYRQQVVNARGRVLLDPAAGEGGSPGDGIFGGLETKWPVPGENLVLALDIRLQLATQEALANVRGAAVAIDPVNGDVLALVSTPAFDSNRFANGLSRGEFAALNNDIDRPLLNRALAGVYPPGSTIKPFLGLVALHRERITPHTSVYCPGHFSLPGSSHRYRDWRPQGHGRVALHESIVRSCDVYFYQLAVELGIDELEAGLKSFGFGGQTGIDIGGESAGVVPSREWKRRQFSRREDQVWFPGETVISGIGQGYTLTTPLQLAHASAVLAAEGRRFAPRLVIGSEEAVSRRIEWIPSEELPGLEGVDDALWQHITAAMVGVTAEPGGSAAVTMKGTSYSIAGKTGTAQVFTVAQDAKYREEDVDERLRDHGLFVAFAPAEAPRIALAVIVENGGGGNRAAAPVARKILDTFFTLVGDDYVAREH